MAKKKRTRGAVHEWFSKRNKKIAPLGGEARWAGKSKEEKSAEMKRVSDAGVKARAERREKAKKRKSV